MPGLIRSSDIDEVRARTNIADIVGEYVTLKGAGGGSMKGLCPFHDERSPSFHVRPQVGFYHCFGCGEGGNVFTFLQKVDGVSFREAVERLAGRIGYELHYEDGGQASDFGQRARILEANRAAELFFREQLATPEAEPARQFLGGRGFDEAAAERFGVGFSPARGLLKQALTAKGFTEEELVTAGLLGRGERGDTYDRFRSRVVWPIRDVTGATLGFGARRLLESDQGPKYLNTPDTLVYHKSQVLYGLDLARRDIARGKRVVIVEGYTDVMAAHLAGVTTAIATCGTAFGVDHIKIVRRILGDDDMSGEVVFTFDPDEAGQKAASRAFAEESRFAAQTFVAVAPDNLDPCDLRLARGDEAVRRLIRTRKPMFEFMIRREVDTHDLETVEGRVAAVRAAGPIIAGIRDEAMRDGYARDTAKWIGVDPSEVRASATAAVRAGASTSGRGSGGRDGSGREGTGRDGGARGDGSRGDGGAPASRGGLSAVPQDGPPPAPIQLLGLTHLRTDPDTRLERDALMAMLQHPDLVDAELLARATRASFAEPSLTVVRDAMAMTLDRARDANWVETVATEVPEGYGTLVTQLGVAPIPEREGVIATYCTSIVRALVDRDLFRRKRDLLGSLQRTDATADPERHRELQRELVGIEAERRALREE